MLMEIGHAIVLEMLHGREVRSEDCHICKAESAYPTVRIATFPPGGDCTKESN
jgi:hypothetical protein